MKSLFCSGVFSLLAAFFLVSCQTAEKPAIVRQVEGAATPVQGLVIAMDHFVALMDAVEQRAPTIASAAELEGVLGSMKDATHAAVLAFKRTLALESVTPQEDAQLQKVFARINADDPRWDRVAKVLKHKAERYAGDGHLAVEGQELMYWLGELELLEGQIRAKTYVVRGR